jgi:DTW domain-containing protein YfiP
VIILQDPKEAKHALSSAPILAKSIIGARLIIGEVFQPEAFLGDNWLADSLLVFPGKVALSTAQVENNEIKNLILLDGTWRKVSRLIHLNPWLDQLPRIAINSSNSSQYKIRKSPREDGLSTIEAAVHVLNDLHPKQDFTTILSAFNKMIEFQITAMGKAKFQRNYRGG